MLVNLLYCPGEIPLDVDPQEFEAGLTSAHHLRTIHVEGLLKPMMSSLVSMLLSSRLNVACVFRLITEIYFSQQRR